MALWLTSPGILTHPPESPIVPTIAALHVTTLDDRVTLYSCRR